MSGQREKLAASDEGEDSIGVAFDRSCAPGGSSPPASPRPTNRSLCFDLLCFCLNHGCSHNVRAAVDETERSCAPDRNPAQPAPDLAVFYKGNGPRTCRRVRWAPKGELALWRTGRARSRVPLLIGHQETTWVLGLGGSHTSTPRGRLTCCLPARDVHKFPARGPRGDDSSRHVCLSAWLLPAST